MRLVSLELHGFKSFADPQKLVFPVGMTAVVGPNGCGKSNISDSLAWVLGEQRASLLRGTEMSDVIFAGTGQRKPMGMAEVKLTLEMPDAALPGATKEVTLTRRLYRDTGSEYRVNGREARLKDVQDLLLDTGLGTRGYTFIQQGQIDLILSSKPKDRRSLLEEAAGITRYKLRRQEAEKRLEETKGNLQRLEDILHELNKQMDSLRRQAAKARRAAELDTEIKATQRILLAGKAEELDHAKQAMLDQLDQLERRVSELTAQASEKASEIEHLRLHLDELEQAQGRRSRQVLGLEQRLTLAEQERGFQEERRREAQDQRSRAGERLEELARRLAEGGQALAALEAELAVAASALEAKEALLAEAEEAVALAQGSLRHEESGLQELRRRKADAVLAAQQRQKQRLAFQSQIAQLEGRLEALNHEESVRAPRLEGLQSEAAKLKGTLEGQESQVEQGEEAATGQRRRVHELEEATRSLTQELHRTQSELEATERQLRQLSDLVAEAAGSLEIRKGLAWLGDRGKKPALLSDLLRADEEVRPSLERILGAWIQTAACDTADLAASKEAPGQLLLAPDTDAHAPASPFGCQPLRHGVRWTGTASPLRALIDRTFRCSDEELPALAAKHPDLGFVSPAFVKLPYGPVQVGAAAPAASPLKLRAELDEAKARRETLITALEELEERHRRETLGAREAHDRLREIEEDLRISRVRRDQSKAQLTSAEGQLSEIRAAQERADALWEQIEGEIKRLQGLLREIEEHPEEAADAELELALGEAETRVRGKQSELDARREARLETARVRDSAWAEKDALQRQLQMHQRGRFDVESERQRLELEMKEQADKAGLAADRLAELEAETQRQLEERAALQAQMQEAQPVLEEAAEHLRVQERIGRELQEALENARAQHQECLIRAAQVQGSMEALSKEVELALGLEVPAFLASITEEERAAWVEEGELVHQTRLSELQGKRLDLGGVNPLAIQELAEAEERLAFMGEQRGDVVQAIENLEKTISEINETSEQRFREAFEFINAKFTEVFREVFNGGTASLTLQDPKDLLECGIEIMAQPPGKTPKSLSLLSGGEKALVAISLLIAIFHFKPSPFCVLDEIDAPLDEANVDRIARLLQKMKADTQFIVITHQKPTMMAADTLYGVTQEEPGCSKLVSVQLKEAEQLV
ncbi:MAG TPA: chromosome segregation protein SMC [Holophagaceae bacterium]|nr:chromosome segregation protein SMC [Holophagaceae bacterium]